MNCIALGYLQKATYNPGKREEKQRSWSENHGESYFSKRLEMWKYIFVHIQ